jgi:hypothetical protein
MSPLHYKREQVVMKREHQFNKNIYAGLSLLFLFGLVSEVFACWGNRPLAMGGAFTGLADDANAVYWNPGGLGLHFGESLTYMSNLGEENNSNYDHYFAGAMQIKDKKSSRSYGTFAFAFVANETIIEKNGDYKTEYSRRDRKRQKMALTDDKPFIDRDTFVQVGYGIRPIGKADLAIGVNFKSVKNDVDDPEDNRNSEWADLDFGAIWRFGPQMGVSKMFSIGFLFQNVGRAKLIESEDAKTPEMIMNFRPGISFKPDAKTVFSAEIYDTLGATEGASNDVSRNVRVGAERWVTDFCALRAGVYHINNLAMRAYTGGIGIKLPKFWNVQTRFDLTVMHWDKAETNTGFGGMTVHF